MASSGIVDFIKISVVKILLTYWGPRKFGCIFDIFIPTRGKFGTGNENRSLFGYCWFRKKKKKDAVRDVLCLKE